MGMFFTENSQADGREFDLDSELVYGRGSDKYGYPIACHCYVCYLEQWHYASNGTRPMPYYWCNDGSRIVYETNHYLNN